MRWAIMQVSRGTHSLKEVRNLAEKRRMEAKRSWDKEVYEKLVAYLDLVLPELERVKFADSVSLGPGVNVMDLSGMKLETQQLIIASTIQYVYDKLDSVVVIIPEAWEMLPQFRMTPVKWVAEQFIRKGAAVQNYLYLDSQDIGGIDKTPLRQVSTWIMGRMMEAHEVERVLKQLLGVKIPRKEIQTLPLGHFYVTVGDQVKKAYVLPAGIPEEVGRRVAIGETTPEHVKGMLEELRSRKEVSDLVRKERYEEVKKELVQVQDQNKTLREQNEEMRKALHEYSIRGVEPFSSELKELKQAKKMLNARVEKLVADLKLFEALKTTLAEILPRAIPRVSIDTPPTLPSEVQVEHKIPTITVDVIRKPLHISTSSLEGRLAYIYAQGELGEKWFTVTHVNKVFNSHGWPRDPRASKKLDELCSWGFLEKRYSGRRPEYRVKISPGAAKEKGLLKVQEG